MKSIKVCEYSRSRSFHDDFILQDQASGERSQDQWSSGWKIHARQLRLGAIWHWHPGILRKLHTKHWFDSNMSMQLLFGIPIMILRLLRWRRCRGLQPGGPAGDGGTPVALVICWIKLSDHPWSAAGNGPP